MPKTASRSSAVLPDAELRLPRPPGVIRRFWARHPLVTDILVALAYLLLTVGTISVQTTRPGDAGGGMSVAALDVTLVVLSLVACGSLLVRRRAPELPLALAIAIELVLLFAGASGTTAILLVACYSMAVYRSNRACWIALGSGVGVVALTGIGALWSGAVSASAVWNAVLGTAVLGLIGTLVGVNVGNRRRYLEAVIDRSRQLLVERDQQAQLAAAAERTRIAREMHDIVSHSLTVVVALSEGASATRDVERARGAMDAAAATARSALTEMRAMLGVLRDPESAAPLTPAAPPDPIATVAAAQGAGFPATIVIDGPADAPEAVRFAVARIVQESVTNAMRHAPDATAIRVRIDRSATEVVVEIINDGLRDAPSAPGGFGLRGLAERVSGLGGTLVAGADAGRWSVRAALPIDAQAPAPPVLSVSTVLSVSPGPDARARSAGEQP